MIRRNPGIVGPFTGLDLRRNAAMSEPASLVVANNVDLAIGGNLKRRDALVKLCDVSSETVGLYAADGLLRTVCPGGRSLQDTRPTEIWYDPIGDGTAYPLGGLVDFHAVEVIPSATGGKAYPYVAVENSFGRIEHHWLNSDPATAADAVNTRVVLPFDPGRALVKSHGKLFADSPAEGHLRYSAATVGPTDWLTRRDAGFLAVRQFSAGAQEIKALSYFKGYVAVLFQDSIQLWQMDPDPSRFQFITALNGPGTSAPRLTKNVLGDMVYFSRGGFRTLGRSLVTGDNTAEDIGSTIAKLTLAEDTSTVNPVAIWSEERSQYIAAFGTTVYALTYSPSTETVGWTTWELPVVADHIVENDGQLYIRSGDTIYKFSPDALEDETGPVDYEVFTAFQHYGNPGSKKIWDSVDVVQDGQSSLNFCIDPNQLTVLEFAAPISITDVTFSRGRIAVNRTCDALALRFTGSGAWRLDSAILSARTLRGRG